MEKNRDRTDKSLAVERQDNDLCSIDSGESERTADKVIEVARIEADAVLLTARETADREAEPALSVDRARVAEAREKADALVEAERGAADEDLEREREMQRDVGDSVRAYERLRTDRDLAAERGDAEQAISVANRRDRNDS
jgi:hypothetical protein